MLGTESSAKRVRGVDPEERGTCRDDVFAGVRGESVETVGGVSLVDGEGTGRAPNAQVVSC